MKSKIILVIVFVLAIPYAKAQVTNQRLFDTIPFLPDHYARRVAEFNSQKLSHGRIIFLGNSITEGGDWPRLTGDSTVINRGIGGDITFGVLKRLNELIAAKPSRLFLLIGINDIGKDIPGAVIADNIRKIIERFQSDSPATKIYIQSILPVNPGVRNFPQHYDKNDHVITTNALIHTVAKKAGVTFIDTFKLFADNKGLLKVTYTNDGLHLNAEGYRLWVDHLKSAGAFSR